MENPRPKRSVCSTQKSDFTYAKSPAQKQQQASSPDQKPPPLKRRRLSPLEQKPPADPPTNDPKKPEKTGASGRTPPPPSSSPSRYPQDVIDWVRRATGLFERKMNAALTANVVQDPEKKVSIDVLSFSEAKLWALLFDPSVSHREFKRIQFDPKIPTHKKKNVLWKKDYRSVRELEGRLGSNFYRCNKGVNVTGVYLQSGVTTYQPIPLTIKVTQTVIASFRTKDGAEKEVVEYRSGDLYSVDIRFRARTTEACPEKGPYESVELNAASRNKFPNFEKIKK